MTYKIMKKENLFIFWIWLLVLDTINVTGFSISPFRSLKHQQDIGRKEDETWISSTRESKCCGKQSKKHFIGYGLDGEQLFVDIGQCRKTCSNKKSKIHRKEFEALLKSNTSIDPVELYLSLQKDISPSSCGDETVCEATKIYMERHMTMSGLQQIPVVEDCSCLSQSSECQRMQQLVVYFPSTPFETVVDVGICSGPCHLDTECRPLRNRTAAIAGPNGDTCIDIIEECSCTSSCYRASSLEYVYDYTETDDSEHPPSPKIIDVGRCIGTCDGPQRKHHCVLRDTEDQSKCLMSLSRRENNCSPSGFQIHRYRSSTGQLKNLLSITDCGCQ